MTTYIYNCNMYNYMNIERVGKSEIERVLPHISFPARLVSLKKKEDNPQLPKGLGKALTEAIDSDLFWQCSLCMAYKKRG